MQLLIPYALVDAPGCAQALPTLQLPALDQLLRRLALTSTEQGSANDLSLPHERELARAFGLAPDDGRDPVGRHGAGALGRRPGPPGMGLDHARALADRRRPRPDAGPARAADCRRTNRARCCTRWRRILREDGIELRYLAPERWLACGESLRQLRSASLDRVIGADVSAWMPDDPALRRLQNEMQMLLYTHPVNDARDRARPGRRQLVLDQRQRPARPHVRAAAHAGGRRRPATCRLWAKTGPPGRGPGT